MEFPGLYRESVSLVPQERADLDDASGLYFEIDPVLRNTLTDEVLCVMDTKYRHATTPASDDVAQIVAYAEKMGCVNAILVFPRELPRPLDMKVGGISVRTLSCPVSDDVHRLGERFMDAVLNYVLVSK